MIEKDLIVIIWSFGDDVQSSGSRQRYQIGLLYFTGHEAISGCKMTGFVGKIAVLSRGVVYSCLTGL